METYGELLRSFNDRRAQYEMKLSFLEGTIERLAKRRARLLTKRPRWIEELVGPVGEAIAEQFLPGYEADLLGPFGLSCEVSIHFRKKEPEPGVKPFDPPNLYSITFVEAGDEGVAVRDTSADTGRFAPGSIGQLNGMNHPTVKIPPDATAEWYMAFVR